MQDATDFGIALRELMARNNLSQGKMAKRLGVSPAILSNYITGKNIPEMDFLAKCIEQFGQKQKGVEKGIENIADFFYKAFLSTAMNNHKVIFDTRYIDSKRIEMLAKVLTVLVLYPQSPSSVDRSYHEKIIALGAHINKYYDVAEKQAEFHFPTEVLIQN